MVEFPGSAGDHSIEGSFLTGEGFSRIVCVLSPRFPHTCAVIIAFRHGGPTALTKINFKLKYFIYYSSPTAKIVHEFRENFPVAEVTYCGTKHGSTNGIFMINLVDEINGKFICA